MAKKIAGSYEARGPGSVTPSRPTLTASRAKSLPEGAKSADAVSQAAKAGRSEAPFGGAASATSSGQKVRPTASLNPRPTKKTAAVGRTPAVTRAGPSPGAAA